MAVLAVAALGVGGALWAMSGSPTTKMIRRNPYELTVNKGMITKLDNEWLP